MKAPCLNVLIFEFRCLPEACNFIKKGALAQVLSCESCEICKNTFLHKTPLVAASISKKHVRNKYEVFAIQIRSLMYQWTRAVIQECSATKVFLKC